MTTERRKIPISLGFSARRALVVAFLCLCEPTSWVQAQDDGGLSYLVADADDDDGNGLADSAQDNEIPREDLMAVPEAWLEGATQVRVRGKAARLVKNAAETPRAGISTFDEPLFVQGISPGFATLLVTHGASETAFPLAVAELRFLDGHNHPVRPEKRDAAISLRITNDGSLPRSDDFGLHSGDLRDLRVELSAPAQGGQTQVVALRPREPASRHHVMRSALPLRVKRTEPRGPYRSRFVRLVSDHIDLQAPGPQGQLVSVSLLDKLRAEWRSPSGTVLSQDIRVGRRAAAADGPSALLARLVVHVLRTHSGGPPVLGLDDHSALNIAREQVLSAGRIWAQCGLSFPPPSELDVRIDAPPPACLLSVASGDGLPARGDGVLMFLADGQTIGPLMTRPRASPLDTAMMLAAALGAAQFEVTVTKNPRTQFGAYGSVDVLVRRPDGTLASLSALTDVPLSTDAQQRLSIGHVDLRDGLQEFDNMNAQAGTLEERTLLKALADDDPSTIDVFLLNHFTGATRQGEAFIEASGGPLINMVIVDRNGLSQRDNAWALAHELGHVLLDEPLHPDNVGPDRPWLLMDADSSRGSVYGPKRLTEAECVRAVYESGPDAIPALLSPLP